MADNIIRIAMWSGPRNISTAMMRAWENRADTFVTDEPFYATYLKTTGIEHPGREAIIASQSTDWREVVNQCSSQTHNNCSVHYQKHMTQHMLPEIDLGWLDSLVNVFLIRSPQEVVSSYARARPDLNAADLGFEQQHRLFQHVVNNIDPAPLVLSAQSVLQNPTETLTAICTKANIAFDTRMLQWPAGKRESDGIWASHWYKNVENSTGFAAPAKDRQIILSPQQQKIADLCQPCYDTMLQHCLNVKSSL